MNKSIEDRFRVRDLSQDRGIAGEQPRIDVRVGLAGLARMPAVFLQVEGHRDVLPRPTRAGRSAAPGVSVAVVGASRLRPSRRRRRVGRFGSPSGSSSFFK